jgi:hypothetical protein
MKKLFSISLLFFSLFASAQNVPRKQVTGTPFIFVDDYGASKNPSTTTGATTSGSNSITVASATGFVAGQYIWVDGARFGGVTNNSISRITSISGTTITTQDNAGATVASALVGHDDTRAIQAAINAAKAAKGGTVYFTNGQYKLRDTLFQNGVGGAWVNAQIYIPNSSTSDSAINITLLGETEPNWEHSILVDWPIAQKGVILESTVVPTSGGAAAILGTEYGSTSFGNWNLTDVTLKNLTFRGRSKTNAGVDTVNKISGINFETQSICTIENVRVDITSKLINSVYPGFQSTYGIIMPRRGNAAWCVLRNIFIGGFDVGLYFNEHTDADNITIAACFRALRSGDMDHSFHFGRVLLNGNSTNYLLEGNSFGDISNMATEHYSNSSGFGTKWYAFTEDILHTAGSPKLNIKYHVVTSAVGENNANWYLHSTGGTPTGIVDYPLDADPSSSSTPALTSTYIGVGNGSNVLSGSSSFTRSGGTVINNSPSGGAVLQMKHPSAVQPWQLVQGYVDADDYAIVRNGTVIQRWTSTGVSLIPALANATPQMVTVGSSGIVSSAVVPVGTTNINDIAVGTGAGQVSAGDDNFQWSGSRLKLYSGSTGSVIEQRHASNTNSWKLIQGFGVVDDWVITHGASDTKFFQLNSSGQPQFPYLGGSGTGVVAVDNSGNLSWSAGGSGGMSNPMTASGDMIYGGSGGTPTRLAAGSNGYILTLSGGVPIWSAASPTSWTGAVNGTSYSATSATIDGTATVWTFTGSSPATFTLPSYASFGNRIVFIKNIGSADLTIARAGTDQIYTSSTVTSFTVSAGKSVAISTAANGLTNTWETLFDPSSGGSGVSDPGANGVMVRTATNTTTARTITGTASKIVVTNGDGVSGNPTISLGADVVDKTSGNDYFSGAKQAVGHSATTSGFNLSVGGVSTDPSSLVGGDFWYNASTNGGSLKYADAGLNIRTVADLNKSQTFTNKTIDLASNTLTATSAQLATALSDETGSGKTVFGTSPVINSPTIGTSGTAGSSHITTVGSVPTVSQTGGGTSASVALETGSTDQAGTITLTTGSASVGSTGTITLTFNSAYTGNSPVILLTLVKGATDWGALATARITTQSNSAPVITWNNSATGTAVALTVSTTYKISYQVIGK